LKRAACLLAAALLMAALALPAFAETTSEPSTLEPVMSREFLPVVPYDGETTILEEETTVFESTAPPPGTTIGIVPIGGELDEGGFALQGGIAQEDVMRYGTLGISVLALLLAVIALARTIKKKPGNATGNYRKYF